MKAAQAKLSKLIGHAEKQFIIPIYQRNYKWSKKNIEQFLDDLEEIDLSQIDYNHFLNSIVYSKINDNELASNSGNRLEKYHIIDGQQRLTTNSLFLIAIRNTIQPRDTKTPNRINNQYIRNEWIDDIDDSIRLRLSNQDFEIYRKLVLKDELNEDDKNHLIYKNYKLLEKYVKNYIEDDFNKIYDLIEKFEKRIDIIDTFLESHDNPQKIFSSLNSTGKALKDTDLIKNLILMNLSVNKQNEFYTRFWIEIERVLDEKLLLNFFQHYLSMKMSYVVSSSNVYEAFEKLFKNTNDIEDIKKLLEELLKFANIYKNLFLTSTDFKYTYKSLNLLNIEAYYPLLMYIEANNNEMTEKTAKIIENYLIRRAIVGLSPGKTKNVFVKVLKNIDVNSKSLDQDILVLLKSEQGQSRYPEIEFEDNILTVPIYSNSKTITKYILYKIEYYLNTKNRSITICYEDLTIEHILPETEYSKLPDCWINDFSLEIFEHYLHTIANLTLITQNKNSSIGNSCFEDKINQYENDTFLLTKEIAKEYEEWNIEALKRRGEKIKNIMLEIWR